MMYCCFDPAYEYTTAAGQLKHVCEDDLNSYCTAPEPDLGVFAPDDMSASLACNADAGSQALHPAGMSLGGTLVCGCGPNGMEDCCLSPGSPTEHQSATPGAPCCSTVSGLFQGSVDCFCDVSFVWQCPGLLSDGGAGD
jgi:hypothetical protein